MTRHILTLSRSTRALAHQGIDRAPDGYVLELREQRRSDEQNKAIHGLCSQVLKQRPVHLGVIMTMAKYKAAFMHLLGSEMDFVPALDGGGFFPMGHHTSALTKGEFSNLIECALAWCAREGIEIAHFDGDPRTDTAAARSEGVPTTAPSKAA